LVLYLNLLVSKMNSVSAWAAARAESPGIDLDPGGAGGARVARAVRQFIAVQTRAALFETVLNRFTGLDCSMQRARILASAERAKMVLSANDSDTQVGSHL
jgi:hypothetical protein